MNRLLAQAPLLVLCLLIPVVAAAQVGGESTIPPATELVKASVTPITVAAGGTVRTVVKLTIAEGWHVNANPASLDYMIPTEVELSTYPGLVFHNARYPRPEMIKVGFEDTELLSWSGSPEIPIPVEAKPDMKNGKHEIRGTVSFQACNDQVCLPPARIPIVLAVTVTGGVDAGRATPPAAGTGDTAHTLAADTSKAPTGASGTFETAPPAGGARSPVLDNPIARELEKGGWAGFLTLFLIGLALNLTPCVYPMLGVTVSIFGARRAAPPLQVLGLALAYVLGMASMYSALGLAAAFTGGLFGGFLQNPMVLVGIGVLLLALALSMFGVYEFQLPGWLRERLGGQQATGLLGTFASGLLVGIFAAPCIGPPVVALLAVVGAKGDPWFGFSSFFTLAMGLGAPYLVLAMSSNLLQKLPRSGDWMEWVKKLFGILLVALGLFYVLLGLAPEWVGWVTPLALLAGGVYLGFMEKTGEGKPRFRAFKRVVGVGGVLAAVVMVATAPRQALTFQPFTAEALNASLAAGRPAMLDFSADWCAPCHELERFTFTDGRVILAGRDFDRYHVDLTHYDSPESEALRQHYEIPGVPTVLFLLPDGREVEAARVVGFMRAEDFLARMKLASGQAVPAATR